MITPLYPTDQVILEMVAAMKQWKVFVMKYVLLFVLSIVQTVELVSYFVRYLSEVWFWLTVVKEKLMIGFFFRAYLYALDFHDVDWKNMDDGRGMN